MSSLGSLPELNLQFLPSCIHISFKYRFAHLHSIRREYKEGKAHLGAQNAHLTAQTQPISCTENPMCILILAVMFPDLSWWLLMFLGFRVLVFGITWIFMIRHLKFRYLVCIILNKLLCAFLAHHQDWSEFWRHI